MKLTKQAINRSLDIAGMRESLLAALEYNVQIETSETAESREFNVILKRDGAKAAIAWRSARAAGADPEPEHEPEHEPEREQQADELRALLERFPDTQQLELLVPDMLGILRGKRVAANEFAKPFGKGVNFCGATVLLDAKGQTFDGIDNGGRDGDPDAIATAVAGTLAPVPWAEVPTAQVLMEMAQADGTPWFTDTRQVLRKAAQPLKDLGFTAVAATELEFYLLAGNSEQPTPRVPTFPARIGHRTARSTG